MNYEALFAETVLMRGHQAIRSTLLGLAAAIDCYGGGVVAKPEELTARQPVAPIDFTKDLQAVAANALV